MAKSKSIQKSAQPPASNGGTASYLLAPAPADSVPALATEARELATIVSRIRDALGSLGPDLSPGDARRVALTVEAELLRLGIRSVNLRAACATLANAAHVAELAAMTGEVRS